MCSLSEALFKEVSVEKINNFLESEDYMSRIGTVAIGKTNYKPGRKRFCVVGKGMIKSLSSF